MSLIVGFSSNQFESQHHYWCAHFSNLEYECINCISSIVNKHEFWYSKSELKDMQTSWARSISRIASKRMTLLEHAKMHVHDTASFLGFGGLLDKGYISGDKVTTTIAKQCRALRANEADSIGYLPRWNGTDFRRHVRMVTRESKNRWRNTHYYCDVML